MSEKLSHNSRPLPIDQNEVLLGIVMLAAVNALWRRDSTASDLGDATSTKNIFAVDTDIVNFFSQPATNTKYLYLPGLLPTSEVADTHLASTKIDTPEVLAQIMGHYMFFGSDHLGAKLMFPSTRREVDGIVEIVKDKAFRDIDKTHQKMINAQKHLNRLVTDYFSDKNSAPEGFIEHFLTKMDMLYPAVFADGPVREFKRFGDLFNQDRQGLLSPHEIVELDKALTELKAEQESELSNLGSPSAKSLDGAASRASGKLPWQVIRHAWQSAIDATSSSKEREVKAQADVETLATIEWCNRWLESERIRYRITFVTGSGKLFGAARLRWGFVRSHHLPPETIRKVAQGAHIFCYYADVLQSGEGSSANDLARQAERYTPLRDVRYFLGDPAFLTYAQQDVAAGGGLAHPLVSATLTEWLQAFLLRMNKEDQYIGRNFMALSGITKRFRDSPGWRPIELEMVSTVDIALFESKWQGFLRQASFNHLIDSGIRRRSLKVLVESLNAINTNKEDTYRLLLDYLHEAHIDVSRAATNLSIVALASKTKQGCAAPMDRCVPPLVLRRFPAAQHFVSVLLKALVSPEITKIQEHLETLKSNHFGVAAEHEYTKKYLDLLLRAYCFAIFREWKGALFLAKEAYLVTQLKVHRDSRLSHEDELAGREAAYLACIASRHAENFDGLGSFDKRCFDWIDRLDDAIKVDDQPEMPPFALEVHRARLASEDLAHELMFRFYCKWGSFQDAEPLTTEVIEILNESLEELVAMIGQLQIGREVQQGDLNIDHRELQVAWLYILRQSLVNLAQTRYLLAESGHDLEQQVTNEQLVQLLENANDICEMHFKDILPESDLHRYVTALVIHHAGRLDAEAVKKMQQELQTKLNGLGACPWALSYDGQKYQAILDGLMANREAAVSQ